MLESDNPFLTGSALEALSGWSNVLKSFQSRLGQYFARAEVRQTAFDYLQALISPVERKNGWQMAELVGHKWMTRNNYTAFKKDPPTPTEKPYTRLCNYLCLSA